MRKLFAALFLIVLLVAPAWADDLTTNLVSYWKLDETSGTREDIHAANDLTDNNTVLYGTGIISNAGDFEHDNSEYLSIAHASQSGLQPGTSDFSVSFWFKPEAQPGSWTLWGILGKGTVWGLQYGDDGGNKLLFQRYTSGWENHWFTQTLTNGTWYHIVVCWDYSAHSVEIYINGSSIGAEATGTAASSDNTDPFTIGSNGTYSYADGLIDEVGYWSRLLTSDEVTALYGGGSGKAYSTFAPAASMRRRTPIIW